MSGASGGSLGSGISVRERETAARCEAAVARRKEKLEMSRRLDASFLSCRVAEVRGSMTGVFRIPFQEWEKNGRGEIHGGILADAAAAVSKIFAEAAEGSGRRLISVSYVYVRPAFPGDSAAAEVRLSRAGRRITARCRLISESSGKTILESLSAWE